MHQKADKLQELNKKAKLEHGVERILVKEAAKTKKIIDDQLIKIETLKATIEEKDKVIKKL